MLEMGKKVRSVLFQGQKVVYYLEGEGEAIVFLHGWPTNSVLWNAQTEKFKDRFKIISLDWLGFGKSDKPNEHNYTFSKKKEILDLVLNDALNPDEQMNIVAHDVGGPPAILWASENQHRVNRLVLLNTVIYPFSTPLDALSHYLFKIPLWKNISVSHFGLKILMKTLTRSSGQRVRQHINRILRFHENWNTKIKLKTILEPVELGKKNETPFLEEKFISIGANKYLIIAKKDPLCYAHMHKLSVDHPEIPSYLLEQSGHFIPVDQPDALNNILAKILEK